MQIPCHIVQLQPVRRHLLQRPLKQLGVVRLEMDLPAQPDHRPVLIEERMICQPTLGIFAARPRVTEINVEQVNFADIKELVDVCCVQRNKEHVFKPQTDRALHRQHQCIRHALDGNQKHIRLRLRRLDRELALSAADLHAQLTAIRHQLPPVSAPRLWIVNPDALTRRHPRLQIVSSSHSHRPYLLS